jgi:LRV iron-sulfur cluster protein
MKFTVTTAATKFIQRMLRLAWGAAMTNDIIDEARNWCGNGIDCQACAHRELLAQGRCALKRACVEDRYARRIDRFFDQNPSLADRYLGHPHFETRAIAAKYASVFLLPPLLNDPDGPFAGMRRSGRRGAISSACVRTLTARCAFVSLRALTARSFVP